MKRKDNMTKIKKNAKSQKNLTHPWVLGKCYIIRTVTMHLVGRLSSVGPQELVLDEAAWLACSSRWAQTLATGDVAEVEPFPASVIVGRGAIVDAAEWTHDLLRAAK